MPSRERADQSPPEPLLQVQDLAIDLVRTRNSTLRVVSRASFDVPAGSITGLLGESGCGKTTLALALPGLLPRERYRVRGAVRWRGRELLNLAERELEPIRGAEIAVIFQDPMLALNPVLRVRQQIGEAMHAHGAERTGTDAGAALAVAGLSPVPRILDAYPHQLSGGERQRVLIALALACRPALVIADEPFTALDSTRVLEISDLFCQLRTSFGASFLLIDHSPAALARIADYALVMYAGRIVERGAAREILGRPLHPYTAGLLRAIPGAARDGSARRFTPIPGNPPALARRGPGCPFEPRCAEREARCASEVPPEYVAEGRGVSCFKYAG
jgi:oligopeptide/dipeptide ABC transporter ATP-binding protein